MFLNQHVLNQISLLADDWRQQQSNHNVSLDTTLPAPEPEVPETPQEPLNRLADVLVNLQNKPQLITFRPVQTTPMKFDGKSEKF